MSVGYLNKRLSAADKTTEMFGNVSNASKLTQVLKTANTCDVLDVYHVKEKRFVVINETDFDESIYVDGAVIRAEMAATKEAEEQRVEEALNKLKESKTPTAANNKTAIDSNNIDAEIVEIDSNEDAAPAPKRKYNRKK